VTANPAELQRKSIVRDYAETILVCVIFIIFSRAFVFQQSKIPSGSMMDTLLVGDYIMVNRFVYAPSVFDWERALLPIRPIRRGDIVVFKHPDEPETDYIKRVIGLPGDTVELRDGVLWVNGKRIEEPYVKESYRREDAKRTWGPLQIDPDKYFVLGDHRNQSADSRYWGEVPVALMKGRALIVWWSFDEAPSHGQAGPSEILGAWAHKIGHFFGGSRWERCFRLIR
jgi:signal peptidase I